MRIGICVFLIIICTLIFISCNTTEPPPLPDGEKPTLNLVLEDVSCIEAWINLTTTNLQLPATLTLKQINPTGDTTSQIYILNTQDSLLYVDSLFQTKTTSIKYPVSSSATSNEFSVTTMDTTSHNFTFENFYVWRHSGSSTLYDVAIINENNIWASEKYVADTSQNGYTMYNAVHWDGKNGNCKEYHITIILIRLFTAHYKQFLLLVKTIFGFAVTQILFTMMETVFLLKHNL